MTKLFESTVSTAINAKDEAARSLQNLIEGIVKKMHLVHKDELEVVKKMLKKTQRELDEMKAELQGKKHHFKGNRSGRTVGSNVNMTRYNARPSTNVSSEPSSSRPSTSRPSTSRPSTSRPSTSRPSTSRPSTRPFGKVKTSKNK